MAAIIVSHKSNINGRALAIIKSHSEETLLLARRRRRRRRRVPLLNRVVPSIAHLFHLLCPALLSLALRLPSLVHLHRVVLLEEKAQLRDVLVELVLPDFAFVEIAVQVGPVIVVLLLTDLAVVDLARLEANLGVRGPLTRHLLLLSTHLVRELLVLGGEVTLTAGLG